MPFLVDAWLDALAIVSPVSCAGCGLADRALCHGCRAALVPTLRTDPVTATVPVISGLAYGGIARNAIVAFKEHGRTDLARHLSLTFRAATLSEVRRLPLGETPAFVPVPSSPEARRRRGFDPVSIVARSAGLRLDSLIGQPQSRGRQKTLSATDRVANRQGAFRARGDCAGRRIVVIDDVVTTGATLREAIRALTEAGAIVIGAVVIARTPLRRISE